MKKSGVVELPLHGGKAPFWLVERMKKLSEGIFKIIIEEYGIGEVIRRLSDPFWFQALSCTLAYDWHSSGTTTVVCGVLKSAIDPEKFGFGFVGGKGKASRKTLSDIDLLGEKFKFSEKKIEEIKYASRMTAKIDSACLQDGYQLYHHSMAISEDGDWVVIQQGMNPEAKYARRYQWLSGIKNFVNEPHQGIVGEKTHENVLDLCSGKSKGCREISTDLAREKPERIKRLYERIKLPEQRTLLDWGEKREKRSYKLPKRVNWKALEKAYEIQPKNYEEMIDIPGIGAATVRGLALISELIFGEEPSWKDPVRFSFAFGGKDGVPYPVDRKAMDESAEILKNAINEAKIGKKEKINALRRLESFINFR
ncbi:MAG: DUF763 domain-containing protein [Candidatus Syntropharchaeia archaeon]